MKIDVPSPIVSADHLGHVHFVGIGGAGLSAIARIMNQRGLTVSGCDGQHSTTIDELSAEGVTTFIGHDAAHLTDVDTLVVSTAIDDSNPEIRTAREQRLQVWPRSAGLQSVLVDRQVVAVAGTHGKTTTSSMLALALQTANRDVGFAIGAHVEALGSNASDGSDALMVVEADESDGAFLVYEPAISVITNVDADHLDQWGSEAAYQEAFGQFMARARNAVIIGADDETAVRLARTHVSAPIRTAGLAEDADVRGVNVETYGSHSRCDVIVDGEHRGELRLSVPGRHYVIDALIAIATALEVGAEFDDVIAGLSRYTGAKRRMEFIGEHHGVRVYDTYAHHPVEIAADLQAARSLAEGGRVIVAFQPHLVSRTQIFGAEMGRALDEADVVAVVDIYLAREAVDDNVTPALITDHIEHAQLLSVRDLESLPQEFAVIAQDKDVLVTMGAGTITTIAPAIVDALASHG